MFKSNKKKTEKKEEELPEFLFHYTNAENYAKILKSKVIKESTDTVRDAMQGRGVYLTSMTPNNSAMDVLNNNYTGHGAAYMDRTERHIRVATNTLDKNRLEKSKVHNAYVYRGEIKLDNLVPYNSNKVYK